MEPLEDRTLLSVFTVDRLTDLNPAGGGQGAAVAGDLRYCVTQANALAGDDAITFGVNGTIQLAGALPILSDLDVQGPGAANLTVRRNTGGNYRIFRVDLGATVVLSGLTVTNGIDVNVGGGIFNEGTLTLNDVTVSGNRAFFGGGIENNGTLTVNDSRVVGNTAIDFGGGIDNFLGTLTLNDTVVSDNVADSSGGGINNEEGTLTLNDSTVSGNRAFFAGGGVLNISGTAAINGSTISGNDTTAAFGSVGGGINVLAGTVTLSHSTVSGNSSVGFGAGIASSGTLTLISSTISANSATEATGGVANGLGTVSMRNTIIAGNTAPDSPDVSGDLGSLGHNLIGDTAGGSGFHATDFLNVNPLLGPLQDNGGPTFTHALLPGSPALDAGDNAGAPATDQRGLSRIVYGAVDIGAFELQAPPVTVASVRVNDGSAQRSSVRSLTVGFSGVVTLEPGAFEVARADGTLVDLLVSTTVVAGQTVATITFTGHGLSTASRSPTATTR